MLKCITIDEATGTITNDCRWCYITSNERINCTCQSSEFRMVGDTLRDIDLEDDLLVDLINKQCHHYYSSNEDKNISVCEDTKVIEW